MSLIHKLRIKPHLPLVLIHAPDDCVHLLDDVALITHATGEKPASQLVLFAVSSNELAHELGILKDYISPETLFWVCYPKKSGAIASDLILMRSWDVVTEAGFRGQTSVSINDDWSALRLTNAPKARPSICDLPMEERKSEGIDYVNRTVQLPPDALKMTGGYPGLSAFFDSLSFTAKKEFALSIADAKKEETRRKRIEKMIAELTLKMHKHGLKGK